MAEKLDEDVVKSIFTERDLEEAEKQTMFWGGENYGDEVESLSPEMADRMDDVFGQARLVLIRKAQENPEEITRVEAIIGILSQESAENYTPNQMAQAYAALRYLEAQVFDPDSEISRQQNLHENGELSEGGAEYLEEMRKMREELYFRLTGLKESRRRESLWGRLKRLDGWLRERHAEAAEEIDEEGWKDASLKAKAMHILGIGVRSPTYLACGVVRQHGGIEAGESVMNKVVVLAGGEETQTNEQFMEENAQLFTLEQAVEDTVEEDLLEALKEEFENNPPRTASGAQRVLTGRQKSKLRAATTVEEAVDIFTGGSGRRDEAEAQVAEIERRVRQQAVGLALEKMGAEELDEWARDVAADEVRRELPESAEELDQLKERVGREIGNTLRELGNARQANNQSEIERLEEKLAKLRIKEQAIKDAREWIDAEGDLPERLVEGERSVSGLATEMSLNEEQVATVLGEHFSVSRESTINGKLEEMGFLEFLNLILYLIQQRAEENI